MCDCEVGDDRCFTPPPAVITSTPDGDLKIVAAESRSVVVVGALESDTIAALDATILGLLSDAAALESRISTLEAGAGP